MAQAVGAPQALGAAPAPVTTPIWSLAEGRMGVMPAAMGGCRIVSTPQTRYLPGYHYCRVWSGQCGRCGRQRVSGPLLVPLPLTWTPRRKCHRTRPRPRPFSFAQLLFQHSPPCVIASRRRFHRMPSEIVSLTEKARTGTRTTQPIPSGTPRTVRRVAAGVLPATPDMTPPATAIIAAIAGCAKIVTNKVSIYRLVHTPNFGCPINNNPTGATVINARSRKFRPIIITAKIITPTHIKPTISKPRTQPILLIHRELANSVPIATANPSVDSPSNVFVTVLHAVIVICTNRIINHIIGTLNSTAITLIPIRCQLLVIIDTIA